MVFKCQEDSFLREYTSKVISCGETKLQKVSNGKKETISCYEVVMEDTILFPEGGGQPCDSGFLDDVAVLQVSRRGTEAVHFVGSSLPVGKTVKQTLNWDRRLDHMQQHSGQHLITAVADLEFGYSTTSWWLGEEESYIELSTPSVKPIELEKIEKIVNDKIRAATPVIVTVYDDVNDPKLKEVRTRGLPEDHKGDVRVITIEGLENNMCCGTHVSNLSQLQAIKLLRVEKGKKDKSNLYFLAGSRVLQYLGGCLQREQKLTALLKNSPAEHVALVDKLQKSLKLANKNLQSVLKELAVQEAAKLKQKDPRPPYFSLHKKEADSDFMSIFVNEVGDTSILLFLTIGEEKGAGQMVLHGEPELVAKLGPQICEILNGKGAGKGSKFQAKVSNLGKRSAAEELIKQHFASIPNGC
ncbi:Alanyl-tRNA editing protein Aarsd1-B [Blattella germanica]|nr:Alanyl-tRNA editing protein Aarsd1-B [Blattella germanica]